MKIIKLTEKYIKDALDLVWTVFEEFESPDYASEGIEEFRKFIEYNSIMEMYKKGQITFWGCFDKEDLTGVIAILGEGHISLLFVKKEYHRRGIARNLFDTVKKICKGKNIDSISVNSSPYATEVYHHLGFIDKGQEQTINGIRFTPMEYLIN
ncbi:MAG: GNAT family N-acetyltransferase [Eubacteriaceae bacterium]|nr:GNAT family N-acetyltransferase [Eubacteriaceae bacterium]